ncbi:MAG: hypothetical protein ACXABY_25795 [Candidatus Thorarchaeota archaeon]
MVSLFHEWLELGTSKGVTWSSGSPGTFFPFPSPAGDLTIITYANPIDQVFYLVFMHGGIWAFWFGIGLLYILSPYRLNLRKEMHMNEEGKGDYVTISGSYVIFSRTREFFDSIFRWRKKSKDT